jgi:alpha-tubulin suppressor-like RCC1 family protein
LVALAALLAACKGTDDFQGTAITDVPVGGAALAQMLGYSTRPGTVMVHDFAPLDVGTLSINAWPTHAGGSDVQIKRPIVPNDDRLGDLVRAGSGGAIVFQRPGGTSIGALGPTGFVGVDTVDAFLFLRCADASYQLFDTGSIPSATDVGATFACGDDGAWMAGSGSGTVVAIAEGHDGSVALHSVDFGNPPQPQPAPIDVTLPPGVWFPRFVTQASDGSYRFVASDASGATTVYGRAGGVSTTTATMTSSSFVFPNGDAAGEPIAESIRLESTGSLLVASSPDASGATIYRWHVESDGVVDTVATADSLPSGFGPWSPSYAFGASFTASSIANPELSTLTVPQAYKARQWVVDHYATIDVPTTPCLDVETCRRLGESTLLGVVDLDSSPVAFYALWAWQLDAAGEPLVAIFASPLDKPTGGNPMTMPMCSDASTCPAAGACQTVDCVGGQCVTSQLNNGASCTNSFGGQSTCDVSGACTACSPGSFACPAPNQQQTCGADGTFGAVLPCPSGCATDKACVAVESIAVGGNSSCAILADKTVMCWGGIVPGSAPGVLPKKIAGLTEISMLALGTAHACAVDSTGGLLCWGDNSKGQLGAPGAPSSVAPTPGNYILAGVTSVAAGVDHTCAVASGNVFCWGANDSGQVKPATPGAMQPSPVLALSNAVTVAAGDQHSCAVTGSVAQCWGLNADGELGMGLGTFTAPTTLPLSGLKAVAAGSAHTCALTTSGIQCWGRGMEGELGDGSVTSHATPAPISGSLAVTELAAGGQTTCALDMSNNLSCWGSNSFGQLGLNMTGGTQSTPQPLTALVGVQQVAVGESHACAMLYSRDVYCWGLNSLGQVGVNFQGSVTKPVQVTF